jgi:N-acetylglutamate synthase-like GNAT family acetyltransferase
MGQSKWEPKSELKSQPKSESNVGADHQSTQHQTVDSINDITKNVDCRTVQLRVGPEFVELRSLQALFNLVAFWASDRTLEDLQTAVEHSDPIVTAWDGTTLIGFARATSDGVYRATIWDVVVDPNYQGAGIGRKLVQTLITHPRVSRVERIYLMTTNQQAFYERIGFTENQTTTMVLHNQPLEMPAFVELECDVGK